MGAGLLELRVSLLRRTQAAGPGSEPLMLLWAPRSVLPTTLQAIYSLHLDSALFTRVGMRVWGKDV